MMKHLKRFVAITISMVMAFQFCTNDFYLYAETEPADPGQTQVTNEPESEPSDSTGEAAEETPPSDIGTPEPSAPVEEQPAAPVEEQPAPPVEEQPEVASTLKVEFVDANNASVKETVEQALTSKYVKDTINLDELGIDINVEGYTLTEVKDKNDNTQAYTTETKDFVLTGNVTELQFVYTQNVQTDQPEDSQEPSTPQGGQEDQNSEEDQEDTDDEDSDSQTNEDENESEDSSKDDELAYPEQILSATASDGATITILAPEGALPEGATVCASLVDSSLIKAAVEKVVEAEGKQLLNYKAYDITIFDKNGNEIQPEKALNVSVTNSGVAGEKNVYHLSDDASDVEKVSGLSYGATQTFSTTHFSIYVVAGQDDIPEVGDALRLTISFEYENGIIAGDTQVIDITKSADGYKVEYNIPEKEGYSVQLKEENTNLKIENGTLTGSFDSNDSVSVTIQYIADTVPYKVEHRFQPLDGTEYEKNSQYPDENKDGKVGELTEAEAKQVEGFTPQIIEQKEIVEGDEENPETVVTVYYDRNEYTLTFDTDGGSYVPSINDVYGTTIDLSNVNEPTKVGYKFDGWIQDNKSVGNSIELTGDITLKANWEAKDVDYKVVYMTENADDDNYSYAGTVTLQAKSGSEVTANKDTRKPSGFDTRHFEYENSTTATVNGDGSTVIVVKYSRNTYTITFEGTGGRVPTCGHVKHTHTLRNCYELICTTPEHTHSYGFMGYGSCYNWRGELTCGKEEHTHSINNGCYELTCTTPEHTHTQNCYEYRDDITITAKYQQNIKDLWNEAVGPGTEYESCLWTWGENYTAIQEIMPDDHVTTEKYETSGQQRTLYYYVEDPEGDVNYKGYTFKLYNTVKFNGMASLTYDEDFYEIGGYDQFDSNVNFRNNKADFPQDSIVKFYYTRSNYTLTLVNGSQTDDSNAPDYKEDLENYLIEPNYNPLGDGIFEGWYLDPEFKIPYYINGEFQNSDGKMPKDDLILYAKWNAIEYTVEFKDYPSEEDNYDEQTYESQTIKSGDSINAFEPTKEGFKFAGWYYQNDDGEYISYDLNMPVSADSPKTIYAKWEADKNTTYTVKYKFVNANGVIVKDYETDPKSGLVGTTVKENAEKPESLGPEFVEYSNYTVDKASSTITLKAGGHNVIEFTYTEATDLQYSIKYVDKENPEKVLYDSTKVEDEEKQYFTSKANQFIRPADKDIVDTYVLPKGYKLVSNSVNVLLTTNKDTNIVIYYCEEATYSITYKGIEGTDYVQDSEGYPSTYNAAELGEGDAGLKIANPEKKGFIFEGWEFTSENGKVLTSDHSGFKKDVVISKGSYGNLEFTAKFEEDQNGDEIPDKYQIKVTYEVKNGKWNDGTNENITEVVTLTDDGTADGEWSEDGSANLSQIPEAGSQPDTGYKAGSWNPEPGQVTKADDGKTYTYSYVKDSFAYTVEYYYDGVEGDAPEGAQTGNTAEFGSTASVNPDKSVTVNDVNYVLVSKNHSVVISAEADKNVIRVDYETDENKDEVPDKYQIKVTYEVKNGKWNDGTNENITEVVTLTDDGTADGEWSEDGSANLSQIPEAGSQPDTGYKAGSWNPEPGQVTKADDGKTYTYSYERDYATIKITPYTGVYDGGRHNVTVNGIIDEDEVSYSLNNVNFYSKQEFEEKYAPVDVTSNQVVYVKVKNGSTEKVYDLDDNSYVNITMQNITVYTNPAIKVFDGTPLTNHNGSILGLVNGETASLEFTGTLTDVGQTTNTATINWGTAKPQNYDVSNVFGILTVVPQSIDPGDEDNEPDPDKPENPVYVDVEINSPQNVTYDGNAHQWSPTVVDGDGNTLVEGTDYTVEYSTTDFTNVTGEIKVTIKGKGNYAGEITRTYQITPRPITLTSGSASKNYDGTALTNSEVSITSGSLVNASDVTYAAVGSITNIGSSLNRISVSYASEQMARNYVVTLVEGTLTVNTAPTIPPTTSTTPPTTPGTPGTTTDDGATTDEPEVEEVEDEETPLSDGDVEDVEDNATPKGNNGIWALINLIAAIVTVILGLILLLSKRHRNDEEEDEEERQARIERGEEKEQEQKRGWICKVLGVIVAIVSVVFFILTEDMSLPMALTDKWTIWMVVIAIVELVLVLVGRHWKDVDDEDQEQQA